MSSVLESIPEKLGSKETWVENCGTDWLTLPATKLREVAQLMNDIHARFVAMTGYEEPGEDGRTLDYHWDLDGQLLGFRFQLTDNRTIESIYDLCEAADWIERETHEGFGVEFSGREFESLLLRQGDKTGVNLREEMK
jgi:NADH:ubiquinone oxidoreductase subunit C